MDSILNFASLIAVVIIIVLLLILAAMKKKLSTDDFTGLGNRKELLKYLEREIKRLKEDDVLMVSMIDLDDFKKINDSRGHMEGDRCLAAFAGNLKTAGELTGLSVFRYGGDEFVIAGRGEASVSERIEKELKNRSCLSFSMGTVWIYGSETMDAAEAFSRADRAMYEAKKK